MNRHLRLIWILVALVAIGGTLHAQVRPEKASTVEGKAFKHADLDIPAFNDTVNQLPAQAASKSRGRLARLGVAENAAHVDKRSERFVELTPTTPLIPGRGVGNHLTWDAVLEASSFDGSGFENETAALTAFVEQASYDALLGYLTANAADLGISPAEFGPYRIAAHDGGDLVQVFIPRQIAGIPVRDSFITATIGQGNLTLLGTHQWGDLKHVRSNLKLDADDARQAAADYLAPVRVDREWGKPELVYIPMAKGHGRSQVATGNGYKYQLAWAVKVNIEGDEGNWEVLVEADKGGVLASEDLNAYAEAKGGVYPKTNDGVGQDGTEQAGWPMPWMFVGSATTTTGGNYSLTGSQTATLNGPYVNMADNCGTDSLTQSGGIDWGTSGGTDCVTPGFGGAGNTHASRSGFYELNRIKEMARSHLPSNTWLQAKLTANMNINNTCNAFWNGSTVNFYRSGGGCANTGEIAAVFDHEWGHGMDANDVVGGIASPSGEGIADIYSSLRLYDSCIGRNFLSTVCSGNGDPCLTCTGVRDIDYLKRQSGNPHTYTWSNANCGGSVHCVGGVYSEAVWSLWKRKLQSAPFNYDNNTAAELVTRLTYIGAGNTSTWFSGGPPNGGCSATSGYKNYLAADDDNGNLNDGTPHMTAIYAAFNDQQIACATPTVQNSGCAGAPTAQPNVTATPGNQQVSLSWPSVSGATQYEVFRAEGIFGCDFGKVKVADSSSTSFVDTGLQNGRNYSYTVIPKSASDACFGPASACDTAVPASAPPTPDFSVSCTPSSFTRQQGQNAVSTCTVTALNGYSGTVNLSCSGNPSGISCGFSPSAVSPTANSTATFTVSGSQSTGTFNFNVSGNDGTSTRTSAISITVTPQGQNGPQTAVYDSGLGAPKCAIPGSSCDSTTLLNGRANLGPEPNQPNTISTCADGTSGTYHNDESNDKIVVTSVNGLDFTEGATVQIAATVYAWSTGTSDFLDLYYAANANSPSWTFITTINFTSGGLQTKTVNYTLPAGTLQAVRAQFRYNGSAGTCTSGSYNDRDDLVFAVNPAAPQCTVNADCSDGLYCNGSEVCNSGTCQAGTAPNCNDSISCTVDSCNESTDSCNHVATNSLCDNGLFCDGSETCSATLGCLAGTAPCPGGTTCDESNDICVSGNCVVDDDFEAGAPAWTNDAASTCSTGAYVTGNPTNPGGGRQIVGSHSGVSSIFTAVNTSAGVNDVDNGNCILGSPSWSVSSASVLEVWYWHGQRDNGDDPSGDFFRLEYSLNNGSTWTTLASRGDQTTTAAWTLATASIPAGSTVKVRMQCSDGPGPGDLVECGLDDLKICN
jgi:hypothetical protein